MSDRPTRLAIARLAIARLAIDPRSGWLLLALGVFLRTVHYLHACSLSVDESHLANNVLHRDFAGLLAPLDERQGAPVLFLLALKAVTLAFGHSEYALRLIAYLSGVLSLFAFRALAIRYLSPVAVPIGIGLFAVAGQLIFYSGQVKQYSSDVLIALALYLLTDRMGREPRRWWHPPVYAVAGALAILASHPAVFLLAGIALALVARGWLRGALQPTARLPRGMWPVFAVWGVAFGFAYRLSVGSLADHQWLLAFWHEHFMPFPPRSLMDVQWYVVAFFQMFDKMLGLSLQGIGALTMAVGCHWLWTRSRQRLALLLLPAGLTLIASGLEKYPFWGRLILFLAPALILLMAEGAAAILAASRSTPLIGVVLIGLLFLHPVMWAGYHVVQPRYEEEIKPSLEHLRENLQPGDVVYLYYRAVPAFRFYADRFGFDPDGCCIIGIDSRDDWNGYQRDLEQLRGHRRVWVLFAHIYNWVNVDDEVLFLHFLDNLGQRQETRKSFGASLYRYDMSAPTSDKP